MPSYPMFAGFSLYLPTKGWKAESTLARWSQEWVLNPGKVAKSDTTSGHADLWSDVPPVEGSSGQE